MLAWKIAPALALGNTVVLKPAEYTPLAALLFAELAHRAGLPRGVLNVVTGDGRTGAALVEHPRVAKIAFTGSTEVGRQIRATTAGSGKSLTLELGGKSPFIVLDDADLDGAVEGVVDAIWFNQGQVCCAGSRLLVQEGIEARFVEKLKRRMETLRVGTSLDKSIDMSTIVDDVQLERIRTLVDKGEDEGCVIHQPSRVALPEGDAFYPPTLITNVAPASTLAQEEIFGPVLVTMSFRTPEEAVALANNTRYGLAASVWSENISHALDVAPRLQCGVVWINATNLFDAVVGFGGYRESGFGREGVYEYLKPRAWAKLPLRNEAKTLQAQPDSLTDATNVNALDRTAKLFINGKQARPDSGYSRLVRAPSGEIVGEVGEGNRKDIRNAVAAARGMTKSSSASAHNRAQVLYYLAENLSARADEFAKQLTVRAGYTPQNAKREVDASIERFFTYAAWADKYDGAVHTPPLHDVALAMHEPLGVIRIVCPDEAPLLGFVSLIAPALALGNHVVVVPSETCPLMATDFYQVTETSDVPGAALNIVTGDARALAQTLGQHDDVDAIWSFHGAALSALAERESIGNLKRTFVDQGRVFDWDDASSEGLPFLRQAVQVKNVWIPYGD
ncbi:Aldehyde dehydrogenase [Candidatus Burkholderia humilis]|nr:Aldehyde dehydrogenase [Candidatus Burkholderia humilis]